MLSVNPISSNNYTVNFQGKKVPKILNRLFSKFKEPVKVAEKKLNYESLSEQDKRTVDMLNYLLDGNYNPNNEYHRSLVTDGIRHIFNA